MEVYVSPHEMWEYLQRNVRTLVEQPELVATNDTYAYEIYALAENPEDPIFYLEVVDESGTQEMYTIWDEEDAVRITTEAYADFIYLDDEEDDDLTDRVGEILSATSDYLQTVLYVDDYANLDDQDIYDIAGRMIYALHKSRGFDIYGLPQKESDNSPA